MLQFVAQGFVSTEVVNESLIDDSFKKFADETIEAIL